MAWLLAVLLVSGLSGVGSAPDLPSLQDDTTCTTPENQYLGIAESSGIWFIFSGGFLDFAINDK